MTVKAPERCRASPGGPSLEADGRHDAEVVATTGGTSWTTTVLSAGCTCACAAPASSLTHPRLAVRAGVAITVLPA